MVELERIRSGDSEALGLLLKETWASLVRYLLPFLDSVEAAEDAAQEAFVRLWEHRDRWESGSARALVFRIGRNMALDLRRRAEVRRGWKRLHRHRPSSSPPTPEEEFMGTEALLRFGEALESLPPRRREVFELVRLRGLSHRDAAEVLELSNRTVANHLRLAMKDMRDMLSDFPAESPADDDQGREVFELIRLRGLSYRDAAEVLDVSDRTVANHLRLAMKDLKDMLSDFPAESPADDDHGREERSSDG